MRAALLSLLLVGACGFNVAGGSAMGDGGGSDAAADDDADLGSGGPLGDGAPLDAMAVACPNGTRWSADFSVDPRTLDVNGDSTLDWVIRNAAPSAALPGQLANGVWTVPGELVSLDTQPKINFDGTTRVHLRMRATQNDAADDQWGSVFWLNAGYGYGHFAPIMISVTRYADEQVARLLTKDPTGISVATLGTAILLGGGMLDLQLVVDATAHSVTMTVNNSAISSAFFVDQVGSPNDDRWATLTSWDVATDFDLIEIENCP